MPPTSCDQFYLVSASTIDGARLNSCVRSHAVSNRCLSFVALVRPSENSTNRLNEPFLGTVPHMSPTDDPRPPVGSVRPSPAPEEMGDEENQLRIQLRERILDAVYPATRNDLLRHIGADERGPVEARLRMLPVGQSFGSVDQVLASLGGMSSPG